MANLSNLLGNLYQGGDEPDRAAEADGRPAPRTGRGPDWASDERLDAAFEDWTAGEMPGMDRDERESLHDEHTEPVDDDADDADDVSTDAAPIELSTDFEGLDDLIQPAATPLDDDAGSDADDEPIEVPLPRSVAAGELVGEPARPLQPSRDDADMRLTDFTAVVERSSAPTADDMPWPDAAPPESDEPWELHHDDILPGRRSAGGLLSRLRGR